MIQVKRRMKEEGNKEVINERQKETEGKDEHREKYKQQK